MILIYRTVYRKGKCTLLSKTTEKVVILELFILTQMEISVACLSVLTSSDKAKAVAFVLTVQYKHLFLKFLSVCINFQQTLQIYISKNGTMSRRPSVQALCKFKHDTLCYGLVCWVFWWAMPRPLIIELRLSINQLFNQKLNVWLAVSCFQVPQFSHPF